MIDTIVFSKNPFSKLSDEDQELFSTMVKDILRTGMCEVSFVKQDGTDRVLQCTLNQQYLPVVEATEEKPARKKNKEVCAVFDTDLNEWRSFRYDSLKAITYNHVQ
jgi:hypothetical protein